MTPQASPIGSCGGWQLPSLDELFSQEQATQHEPFEPRGNNNQLFMKNYFHFSVVWLGFLSIVVGNSIKAQSVIATYDISTANSFTTATVTPTTGSGVAAGNLTAAGVSPKNFFPASFVWNGWGTGTSLDPTKYLAWSITPTAGNQINFAGAKCHI